MKLFNEEMLEKLRLTVGDVLTPDLLIKEWRVKSEGQHHTYGHCYVAAEALFHLCGGWESEWRPKWGRDDEGTHWWLYSNRRKRIYDPSKEQYLFVNEKPPYDTAKNSGFLTKFPSKRAVIVMNRVKEKFPADALEEIVEASRSYGLDDFI